MTDTPADLKQIFELFDQAGMTPISATVTYRSETGAVVRYDVSAMAIFEETEEMVH